MNRLLVLGKIDLVGTDSQGLQALLGQPKRLALLVYLAMAAPAYRSRETLFAMFWPESDAERARQALNQALHHLRRLLEPDVILSRGNEVGISPLRFGCDAVDFYDALRRGERNAALSLYQGDLLPGFHVDAPEFERWMDDERGALRMRAARAAWALAEESVASGELTQAGRYARRAAELSATEETVVRDAIDLLDRIGDRAGALAAYDHLARRLMEDYQAEPSAETRELIARVRSRTDALQPTPAVLPPIPPKAAVTADRETAAAVEETESGPALPLQSRRPFRIGAAIATAIVVVIALVWAIRSNLGAPQASGPPRIRVESFENLGGDTDTHAFARAFTSALVAQLTSVDGLEVIAGDRPPPAASEAPRRFELVVRGSVLESNGILRINVELAEPDGRTLGAAAVDRPAEELFALIDGASQEVARLLRVQLGREVRLRKWQAGTANVAAWQLVQRAEESRAQATELDQSGSTAAALASLEMADSLLARAEREDPRWAEPIVRRASISEARSVLLYYVLRDLREGTLSIREGIGHAERALALESENPHALELHARMIYRMILSQRGMQQGDVTRLRRANEELRRVVAVDPARATAWNTLSSLLFLSGDFSDARWAAEHAFQTDIYLEHEQDNLMRLFQTSYEVGDSAGMRHWCSELGSRLPRGQARSFCELQLLALIEPPARRNVDLAWNIMQRPTDFGPILQNPPMLMTTAAVIARAGLTDSAESVVIRARMAGEDSPELLTLEAYVRMQLSQPDSAAALLETFLDLRPLYFPGVMQSRKFKTLREHPRLRSRLERE